MNKEISTPVDSGKLANLIIQIILDSYNYFPNLKDEHPSYSITLDSDNQFVELKVNGTKFKLFSETLDGKFPAEYMMTQSVEALFEKKGPEHQQYILNRDQPYSYLKDMYCVFKEKIDTYIEGHIENGNISRDYTTDVTDTSHPFLYLRFYGDFSSAGTNIRDEVREYFNTIGLNDDSPKNDSALTIMPKSRHLKWEAIPSDENEFYLNGYKQPVDKIYQQTIGMVNSCHCQLFGKDLPYNHFILIGAMKAQGIDKIIPMLLPKLKEIVLKDKFHNMKKEEVSKTIESNPLSTKNKILQILRNEDFIDKLRLAFPEINVEERIKLLESL